MPLKYLFLIYWYRKLYGMLILEFEVYLNLLRCQEGAKLTLIALPYPPLTTAVNIFRLFLTVP
jgi:hypothetical protein